MLGTQDTDVMERDRALSNAYLPLWSFLPREGGGDLTTLGSPRIFRRQPHLGDLQFKSIGSEEGEGQAGEQ